MKFLLQIALSMFLGIVVGIALGPEHENFIETWIAPIGTIFLRLLRVMVFPLVISSLIVGVYGLGDISKFGRIGGKTFALYMLTTFLAVCIAIGTAVFFEPGVGLNLQSSSQVVLKEIPSFTEMIVDIFPYNSIRSMAEENMLQLIVFSIIFGLGALLCGEKVKLAVDFAEILTKICYKIIAGVMKMAPIGVFALLVSVVAVNGGEVILPLFSFIVCVYLALFLHGTFVYGCLLKFFVRVNVFKFLKKIFPATAFAFSSSSSSATLPVTMTYCRWMNITKEITSFVLPLGATINMDGAAIYYGLSIVFIAQIYGVQLSVLHYFHIALMVVLLSIGASGVPGSAIMFITIIASAIGLPLEGVALVAGVDRILDMGATALNVTGDMVVCGAVAKSEGETLDV